jgi:hypothetical protein
MIVKFEIKYEYRHETYHATVTAWLPNHDAFRANYFNGCPIWSGEIEGSFVKTNFYFSGESQEEIDEKIITAIKEYKSEVSKSLDSKKEKKVILVDFPDPVN